MRHLVLLPEQGQHLRCAGAQASRRFRIVGDLLVEICRLAIVALLEGQCRLQLHGGVAVGPALADERRQARGQDRADPDPVIATEVPQIVERRFARSLFLASQSQTSMACALWPWPASSSARLKAARSA